MPEPQSISDRLDDLEKKVEKATVLIENLRAENKKLKETLAEKIRDAGMAGSKLGNALELEQELTSLQKRNQELENIIRANESWIGKKDGIRKRLETLLTRLAKLEEPTAEIPIEDEEEV